MLWSLLYTSNRHGGNVERGELRDGPPPDQHAWSLGNCNFLCGTTTGTPSTPEMQRKRKKKRSAKQQMERMMIKEPPSPPMEEEKQVVEEKQTKSQLDEVRPPQVHRNKSGSTADQTHVDVLETKDDDKDVYLTKHYVLIFFATLLMGYFLSLAEAPREQKIRNRMYRQSQRIKETVDQGIEDGWIDDGFKKDMKRVCRFVSDEERQLLEFDVTGSTFFLATVLTTIGYGNYAPRTPAGRFITCFVAIFYVAWFGYVLSIAAGRGERVLRFFVLMWNKGCRFQTKLSKKQLTRLNKELFAPDAVVFRIGLVNVAYVLFLAAMGYFSGYITIGNSFYMSIITFSTVGLGDVAPPFHKSKNVNGKAHTIELVCLTIIAMFGLTFLAMLLSSVEIYFNWRFTKMIHGDKAANEVLGISSPSNTPAASDLSPSPNRPAVSHRARLHGGTTPIAGGQGAVHHVQDHVYHPARTTPQ